MKTKIHYYHYDISKAAQREERAALLKRLREESGRGAWMNCISDPKHRQPARNAVEEVTLETEHLFSNQWNTTTSRVFDWYEEFPTDKSNMQRVGHWLELTPEMLAIRRDTLKCAYTGQQFPASSGLKFNTTPGAIGSEYLKESELFMLRLSPVCEGDNHKRFIPLTDEERAYLLPLYRAAQKEGAATRAARKLAQRRKEVLEKFQEKTTVSAKQVADATAERDGMLWLMDHGLSTENVIYYEHSGRFGFGWRQPMTAEEASPFLDVLSEFPFEYDIKRA